MAKCGDLFREAATRETLFDVQSKSQLTMQRVDTAYAQLAIAAGAPRTLCPKSYFVSEQTPSIQYNARKCAALNCLRKMQCPVSTLPDPSFSARVPILRHCDAFVTNFTAAEFRALYSNVR
ncbi:hypothetical protein EVAR_49340_1 [Eumeta japonica]|uniref:Uncharacterized protein n=1 Tax=Eumeta variegata TaxID=151549 RepID=A0A4C1XTY6_EUMVA|nr:hypothetical protein EVAR_49340_1 [Eumeta japonica]